MDGVQDLWEGEYTYRCILTNDYESSAREIVEFYNLRGGKESIFDDMNNGFFLSPSLGFLEAIFLAFSSLFPTASPSSPAIVDVTCGCIFVSFIMRIKFVF